MNIDSSSKILLTFISQYPHIDQLTQNDIAPIYQQLIDCITDHNHRYYVDASPIISDYQYDQLFAYLQWIEQYFPELISSNSPSQSLAGQITEEFSHADHIVPLLSLENSYNAKDIQRFHDAIHRILDKNNITKRSYTIEPKFDGISVEIIYRRGKLHQVITRGDGITGDDVTINAKTISNLPHNISYTADLYLRGEIMMPKSVRKQLNTNREQDGLQIFSNPRNAAAGSMKLLDSSEVKKRKLVCYVYDILKNNPTNTHQEDLQRLEKQGLPTSDIMLHHDNIQEVIHTCLDSKLQNQLHSKDIEFDGLVIKINENNIHNILGATNHHPRRAIAYKYPAQLEMTKLLNVEYGVGRTGEITFVAHLEPINIGGVTVKRATLHNRDFITNKDIQLGDHLRVQRSGEVIPYIVGVESKYRENTKPIQKPSHCPSCNQPTIQQDFHFLCSNVDCPAQRQERLKHFVSKQALNIETIGDKTTELFVQLDLVHTPADLYKFLESSNQHKLKKLPGFGDKKADEIAIQLEESKHQALRRLINGLGIPNVGKKTAQLIHEALQQECNPSDAFSDQDFIQKLCNEKFLQNIYGIGDKIIAWIIIFLEQNKQLITQLYKIWLNFHPHKYSKTNKKTAYSNKRFSITGSFPISRSDIIAICEQQDMIFDTSPTSKTDYMLVGDKAGSKVEKAKNLGIQLISGFDELVKTFPFLSIPSDTPAQSSLF
jgi:DNA ligase (NAD+)